MKNVRIAVLSVHDEVCAYLDNTIPDALHYYDDELHMYLKGTANTFSFTASAKHEDSQYLVEGNKISFRYDDRDYYLNIMTAVKDEHSIEVMAYSLSFELLNEEKEAYTATSAMTFEQYLDAFDYENVVTLGINEVSGRSIKTEWDGTQTLLARLFSLANVFSAEIEFVPVLNTDYSLNRIVMNVYQEHTDTIQGIGTNRTDIRLRYGKNIDGITKTSDITELYTAIRPFGKDGLTIRSLNKTEYDSEGNVEYTSPSGNRNILAPQARDRFPSNVGGKDNDRYIAKIWEYDTDNVNTLYGQALAQLKANCVPQVKYEVTGYVDSGVGDTYTIVDEEYNPPLYLEARITEQVLSLTDVTRNKTTFDNFKELQSEVDSELLARMQSMIDANKVYACSIITDNGIVFKNGEGSTTLTANIMDAGKDMTDELTVTWYKDGEAIFVGKSVLVEASSVVEKAIFRYEATDDDGVIRGFYEITVSNVVDGTSITIKSAEIQYQVSSSGTTPPTGEWSNEPIEGGAGEYVWTKTEIVYSDESDVTSYAVARNGSDGQDIIAILLTSTDGYVFKNTDIATTMTARVFRGGTELTGAELAAEGTLVWYEAGAVTPIATGPTLELKAGDVPNYASYIVQLENLKTGVKASATATLTRVDDGTDGTSIATADVEYYVSTSSSNLDGGEWSIEQPDWTDGKYIWSRVKTTLSDGTLFTTSPACITGGNGATGKGVASIIAEYYLSTSKTSQEGGGWVTTAPTWIAGRYMWIRNRITYQNPTSVAYTTPICDSSWEAVNEIEIGGRNLLLDSANISGIDKTFYEVKTASILQDIIGEKIVVSFDLKATDTNTANTITVYPYQSNGISIRHSGSFTLTTDYKRYAIVTEAYDWGIVNSTYTTGGIGFFMGDSNKFSIKNVKIEKGNKPTDWTPAPEDAQVAITNLEEKTDTIEASVALKTDVSLVAFRYVRDWLNGSTANTGNHWVECQVVASDGDNIAEGLTATCKNASLADAPVTNVEYYTDGIFEQDETSNLTYAQSTYTGWHCLQLDLGSVRYDITELRVFHYYSDGRRYNHMLQVSADGVSWTTLFNSEVAGTYPETENGRVYYLTDSFVDESLASLKVGVGTIETRVDDFVNGEFTDVQQTAEELSNRVGDIDSALENIDTSFGVVNTAINDLRNDSVSQSEFTQTKNEVTTRLTKIDGDITSVNQQVATANGWRTYIAKLGMIEDENIVTYIDVDINGVTVTNPTNHRQTVMTTEEFAGYSNGKKIFYLDEYGCLTDRIYASRGMDTGTIKIVPVTVTSGSTSIGGLAYVKSGGAS